MSKRKRSENETKEPANALGSGPPKLLRGSNGQPIDTRRPIDITWWVDYFLHASHNCAKIVLSYLELVTAIRYVNPDEPRADYMGFEIDTTHRQLSVKISNWGECCEHWDAELVSGPAHIADKQRLDPRVFPLQLMGELRWLPFPKRDDGEEPTKWWLTSAGGGYDAAVEVALPTERGSIVFRLVNQHNGFYRWPTALPTAYGTC